MRGAAYSHSTVAGGLLEMSYTTRPTPVTSLVMRAETASNASISNRYTSAVMKSSLTTARKATTSP